MFSKPQTKTDYPAFALLFQNYAVEHQKVKEYITEALKLRDIYIRGSLHSSFQEVKVLQEVETKFKMQQISIKRVLTDLSNSAKDLRKFVDYINKHKGEISLDVALLSPHQKRLEKIKEAFNKISNDVTNYNTTSMEDLNSIFQQMKVILKDHSPITSEEPNEQVKQAQSKRRVYERSRVEKKISDLRIAALYDELAEYTNSQLILETEIKEARRELNEKRISREGNPTGPLDYMLTDLRISRERDEEALIQPLSKRITEKEKVLRDLPGNNFMGSTEERKFQFICLLDNGRAMNKEFFQEMIACMTSLLNDRSEDKDKFSLIVFNKKAELRVQEKSARAVADAVKDLKVTTEESIIFKAFTKAFELVRNVDKTQYTPIIIMFTNPEEKTSRWLISSTIKPISDSVVQGICETLRKGYNNHKSQGLRTFICGGSSPDAQMILKNFARAANGGETHFKGGTDIHDYYNTTRVKRTLIEIFRDLSDSGRQDAQWSVHEATAELENFKNLLKQQRKFIESKYASAEEDVKMKIDALNSRRRDDMAAEDDYYTSRINELSQRKSQCEEKARNLRVQINDLRNESPTDDQISELEMDMTLTESQLSAQRKPVRSDKFILNPKGVDIEKALKFFENSIITMKLKTSLFLAIVKALSSQTEEILEGLSLQADPTSGKMEAVKCDTRGRIVSVESCLYTSIQHVLVSTDLCFQTPQL